MRFFSLIIIVIITTHFALGQNENPYKLHIKKTNQKISIDGKLNEEVWSQCEKANRFFQVFPADTSFAKTRTEAMLTYDDQYLYVGAICYDDLPGEYVVQSLKRDFSYPVSDAFVFILDPFSDHTNGFAFSVNPYGVQREGLLANGGFFGVSTDWDNLWYSEVYRTPNAWYVEMAIPFKTLRYKEGITEWNINFGRNDLKRNESSTWVPVPRVFNIATLNFTGHLLWDSPPKKRAFSASLIPYISGGAYTNYKSTAPTDYQRSLGLDAKVAVTSSLNLDITINPDFSQVEVDRQQVNLTRFSLAYPEKRLFFIENSDIFAMAGFRQIRPFFSRMIGLFQNPTTLQLTNIPIFAGMRLSGRINKKWRIGVMSMQTGIDSFANYNGQNYFVTAAQRQLFKSSNISFMLVNRQLTKRIENSQDAFNRVLCIDYNLQSANNRWVGKFFIHQSFSPQIKPDWRSNANATFLTYMKNTFYFAWNHEYVGSKYKAETGFVPRIHWRNAATGKAFTMSYFRFEPEIGGRYFPKNRKLRKYINSIKYELYNDTYIDSSFKLITDLNIQPNIYIIFQNSAEFWLEFNNYYTNLMFPQFVLPGNTDFLPNSEYYYKSVTTGFVTNKRKKLNATCYFTGGGFYTGNRKSFGTEINYRIQPYGIITIYYSHDFLSFPFPYQSTTINLAGFKAEISFSRNLFLTSYIQYNTQTQNGNINLRMQYRFKPMSDLFIVYSDNYDPYMNIKNRAIMLKGVYWFNL